MKKLGLLFAWGLGGLAAWAVGAEAPKVVYKPLSVGALQEFGQIRKGIYATGSPAPTTTQLTESDWIDHFGAFITKEAVINERLHLTGGLGGLFQFRKPEMPDPNGAVNSGFPGAQRKAFFVGPTDAQAIYHVGEIAKPWLKFGGGMFMYKYNPTAYNLGEFLFRSGAYPTYTQTGGYAIVNSAAANMQGLRSSLAFGGFKADAFLTTETGLAPLYDWSLATLASYTLGEGLFEVGAGVNFKRIIPVKPSRTAKHLDKNGYFELNGTGYSTNRSYYSFQSSFYKDKLTNATTAQDSATALARISELDTALAVVGRALTPVTHEDSSIKIGYFSGAGTLLMGRFSIDPKKPFGEGLFGPEDLKLYGEAAILGVKNYPIFYKKVTERMPVMLGFNFPGFKLLDLIAIQGEYFNSPSLNNTAQVGNGGYNIPAFPLANDKIVSKIDYNDITKEDNYKWSVLVRKNLGANITLSGQVANDHMRLTSSYFYYGPQFDHNEITTSKDHWYWMTQLSWGI